MSPPSLYLKVSSSNSSKWLNTWSGLLKSFKCETRPKRLLEIPLPLTNKADVPVNDESTPKPSTFSKFKSLVLFIDKLSIEATWVSLSSPSLSSIISSLSSSIASSVSLASTSSISSDKDDKVSIWFKVSLLVECDLT